MQSCTENSTKKTFFQKSTTKNLTIDVSPARRFAMESQILKAIKTKLNK